MPDRAVFINSPYVAVRHVLSIRLIIAVVTLKHFFHRPHISNSGHPPFPVHLFWWYNIHQTHCPIAIFGFGINNPQQQIDSTRADCFVKTEIELNITGHYNTSRWTTWEKQRDKNKATTKSEIHNIWVYHWVYYSDTRKDKRKHSDEHCDWHPTGEARCLHYYFYLLLLHN